MAGFSLFLFAGQFASFVVISEINAQLRSVDAVNAAIGNELAAGSGAREIISPQSRYRD